MNWRNVLIGVIVAAVLIAGGVFTYFQFFAPETTEAPAAAEVSPEAGPNSVADAVDTIAVRQPGDSVSAEGQIVPSRQANLAFAGAGQVAEILAREGDTLVAGAPILRLDTADQEIALSQAEAALAQANANLATAQAGVTAAQAGVDAARVGISAAEAQLALVTAEPREEEIAVRESSIALASAQIGQASAAQSAVLEGAAASTIQGAEAQLAAAEAAAVPVREQLDVLRRQENPDEDALSQAERDYAAALAQIEAARVAVAELREGATAGQRQSAGGAVSAAVAQQEAAEAELDLLLAGSQREEIAIAAAGVTQAEAQLAEAEVRLQQAQAAVAQAEAGVAQAEAAVVTAQTALADRTLVAPFDGLLADLTVELGEVVSPGIPVAILADISNWLLETTDLTELDVVGVAVGDPAEARADALPDTVLTGTVSDIATVSQDVRGDVTYVVTIELDDPGDVPLRWGMTVFTTIDGE